MGHGEIIHDLVLEGIAVEKIRAGRLMAHSNRGGKHSIIRHLSIKTTTKESEHKREVAKQVEGKKGIRERRSGLTANPAGFFVCNSLEQHKGMGEIGWEKERESVYRSVPKRCERRRNKDK